MDGYDVSSLNHTFNTLVPKVVNPSSLFDYRPINLVNSLYKVLAKILYNLLRKVMNEAYDSVDHKFLDLCLEGIGFGDKWRGWIRHCIISPTISVLVNGSPTKEFGISKGLRQGDPLSPLFFNIVVEALNRLLLKARDLNFVKGKVLGREGIHLSHLQFVDDTIMFIEAKEYSVINVRRILRCFEIGSGFKINFHKSILVKVGKVSSPAEKWVALFRCQKSSLPFSYLGLPFGGNPNRIRFWDSILERIRARLAPWKMRFLSKAGRLVLIKFVLSSLLTYFLSVFKIPAAVALAIEKMQREFFWGDKRDKRSIHLVDWETLCRNRRNDGLGIGRIQDKGNGLLAKWIWRFGNEVEALWRQFVCAKYSIESIESHNLVWD
ncbi:hypothetical protein Ddye_013621 [Dipteronia dyeriana]|uniref:Reverse transcriptase domain-containing protein n=1 Tax=Dipteronia dyeriana TaxID=168575 RepID=A0AAD9X6M4_9ROSI|nr:hypothetical protein Ddye_013621 [Dipteronia dyeriana]